MIMTCGIKSTVMPAAIGVDNVVVFVNLEFLLLFNKIKLIGGPHDQSRPV